MMEERRGEMRGGPMGRRSGRAKRKNKEGTPGKHPPLPALHSHLYPNFYIATPTTPQHHRSPSPPFILLILFRSRLSARSIPSEALNPSQLVGPFPLPLLHILPTNPPNSPPRPSLTPHPPLFVFPTDLLTNTLPLLPPSSQAERTKDNKVEQMTRRRGRSRGGKWRCRWRCSCRWSRRLQIRREQDKDQPTNIPTKATTPTTRGSRSVTDGCLRFSSRVGRFGGLRLGVRVT